MAMKYLSWKCVLWISIVAFTAGGILMVFDYYDNGSQDSTYSSSQTVGGGNFAFQSVPYDFSDYSTVSSTVDGWMIFSDYYWGFTLDYPEDWVIEPSMSGTFFTSPYENSKDVLLENASIAIEDLSSYPDITLQEYAVGSLNYLNGDSAYSFVEQGESFFGEYAGWFLLGTYNVNEKEAGVRSLFILRENRAYIFTYMYELPEKESYQLLMESMVESFVLIPGRAQEEKVQDKFTPGDYGFTSLFHLKHF